jgi:hypothetical protein
MPPSVGASERFDDPSVGVDRHGNFYFANLAADTAHGTIQVNKSTDGGNTWSPGAWYGTGGRWQRSYGFQVSEYATYGVLACDSSNKSIEADWVIAASRTLLWPR